MIGQLTKAIYKYENVELTSGYKVTANEVTIQDGKVIHINGAVVNFGEDNCWNFPANSYSGGLKYNINNLPAGMDGNSIIEEFISVVEGDIV